MAPYLLNILLTVFRYCEVIGSLSYWGDDNGKGVVLWAKSGFTLNLGYGSEERIFQTALEINGTTGDINVNTALMYNGVGFKIEKWTIGSEPGVLLKNKYASSGIFLGNYGSVMLYDHAEFYGKNRWDT